MHFFQLPERPLFRAFSPFYGLALLLASVSQVGGQTSTLNTGVHPEGRTQPSTASASPARGQVASKPFALTIDNIMRGPELIGYAPVNVHWSQDGRFVYFDWKQAGESRRKEYAHYVVNADGSGLHRLIDEDAKRLPPQFRELSPDKHLAVYSEAGDIYLYDFAQNQKRQLTATMEAESNPRFTLDGKNIVFERQGNLYELALDGGGIKQLTDIRRGTAPEQTPFLAQAGGRRRTATPPTRQNGAASGTGGVAQSGASTNGTNATGNNATATGTTGTNGARNNAARNNGTGRNNPARQNGNGANNAGTADTSGTSGAGTGSAASSQEALQKAQAELFESLREDAKQRAEQDAKRRQEERGQRKPFMLAAGQSAFGLRLSPDGEWVSLTIREGDSSERSAVIPRFITESGYTEEIPGRGKVGDAQGATRMAVLNVATGDAKPIVFTPPAFSAEGLRSGTRRVNWSGWQWSEDGKRAIVTARTTDNKDAWLLGADPATGATKVLAHLHDDAWVGRFGAGAMGFLPDNRHVYFVSEADGYAHLYTVSTEDGAPVQLTQGHFEVLRVRLSEDKQKFYFLSSEDGPTERALYSMSISGGTRTRIVRMSQADEDDFEVSPDDKTLAIVRSTGNRPPELFLMPNRPSASDSSGVSTSDAVTSSARTASTAQTSETKTTVTKTHAAKASTTRASAAKVSGLNWLTQGQTPRRTGKPMPFKLLTPRHPNGFPTPGSIRPLSRTRRGMARRCMRGCTNPRNGSGAGLPCCSCMARAICKTPIRGGATITASICFITC